MGWNEAWTVLGCAVAGLGLVVGIVLTAGALAAPCGAARLQGTTAYIHISRVPPGTLGLFYPRSASLGLPTYIHTCIHTYICSQEAPEELQEAKKGSQVACSFHPQTLWASLCTYVCMYIHMYIHISVQENKETYNIDCTPT